MTAGNGPAWRRLAWAGPFAVGLAVYAFAVRAEIVFRHVLDNEPLDVTTEGSATQAFEKFRETGTNPYAGDAKAIAAGRMLYNKWCQSCHLADGSGRIGPSLIDNEANYERTDTPVGMFEITYGGGTGAMQSFKGRLNPDEILQIIAYIQSLKK